jgi:hypothetical protein
MEQVWIFDRLAVTLARIDFLDPALADQDDVRERGVRVEIREVHTTPSGSIYASAARQLRPAVCRIDLLESAPYAVDRMHWHPVMEAGEPGERTFEVTMVDDPLRWLGDHLRQTDVLLAQSGVPVDDRMRLDIEAIREVVPDIVAAAARGLEWARVEPWPVVDRDERGLAVGHQVDGHVQG